MISDTMKKVASKIKLFIENNHKVQDWAERYLGSPNIDISKDLYAIDKLLQDVKIDSNTKLLLPNNADKFESKTASSEGIGISNFLNLRIEIKNIPIEFRWELDLKDGFRAIKGIKPEGFALMYTSRSISNFGNRSSFWPGYYFISRTTNIFYHIFSTKDSRDTPASFEYDYGSIIIDVRLPYLKDKNSTIEDVYTKSVSLEIARLWTIMHEKNAILNPVLDPTKIEEPLNIPIKNINPRDLALHFSIKNIKKTSSTLLNLPNQLSNLLRQIGYSELTINDALSGLKYIYYLFKGPTKVTINKKQDIKATNSVKILFTTLSDTARFYEYNIKLCSRPHIYLSDVNNGVHVLEDNKAIQYKVNYRDGGVITVEVTIKLPRIENQEILEIPIADLTNKYTYKVISKLNTYDDPLTRGTISQLLDSIANAVQKHKLYTDISITRYGYDIEITGFYYNNPNPESIAYTIAAPVIEKCALSIKKKKEVGDYYPYSSTYTLRGNDVVAVLHYHNDNETGQGSYINISILA